MSPLPCLLSVSFCVRPSFRPSRSRFSWPFLQWLAGEVRSGWGVRGRPQSQWQLQECRGRKRQSRKVANHQEPHALRHLEAKQVSDRNRGRIHSSGSKVSYWLVIFHRKQISNISFVRKRQSCYRVTIQLQFRGWYGCGFITVWIQRNKSLQLGSKDLNLSLKGSTHIFQNPHPREASRYSKTIRRHTGDILSCRFQTETRNLNNFFILLEKDR